MPPCIIFLPTIRLANCTGIFCCACVTATTPKITKKINAINNAKWKTPISATPSTGVSSDSRRSMNASTLVVRAKTQPASSIMRAGPRAFHPRSTSSLLSRAASSLFTSLVRRRERWFAVSLGAPPPQRPPPFENALRRGATTCRQRPPRRRCRGVAKKSTLRKILVSKSIAERLCRHFAHNASLKFN